MLLLGRKTAREKIATFSKNAGAADNSYHRRRNDQSRSCP